MSDELGKQHHDELQGAHDRFADNLTAAQAAESQQAAAEPNAGDLAWLNQMQAEAKGRDGQRLYASDSTFRAKLEDARARVFRGESIAEIRRLTDADLGGRSQPAAPAAAPQADDTGDWGADIDVEGFGKFTAPEGIQMDREVVGGYAHAARAAGISPSQFQAALTQYAKENAD